MRTLLQKILSIFLVILMLAFTVGISVYKHYCGCTNQQIASLFVEVTCADKQIETCCVTIPAAENSCCAEPTQDSCEHDSSCDIDGCCKTELDIIQIESEYQASQEKFPMPYAAVLIAIVVSEIISDAETKLFAESFYSDPPPPVYGRQFLTAVHQLKFDIPVC